MGKIMYPFGQHDGDDEVFLSVYYVILFTASMITLGKMQRIQAKKQQVKKQIAEAKHRRYRM